MIYAAYSDEYYTYTVISECPLSIVIPILLTPATASIILVKKKIYGATGLNQQ